MKPLSPILFVLPLLAIIASGAALAQELRPTQSVAPTDKPKPAAKAKPKAGSAKASSSKSEADYLKTIQQPRRITRDQLEDDPSSPTTPRFAPSLTPEGRPAMGARF